MSKTRTAVGKWLLPQPPAKEEKQYIPIPRFGIQHVPFGYVEDPDNPDMLLPVPTELGALEEAKEYLKQYSSRKVAAWLTTVTGREISHAGLLKRVANEQKHKNRASTYRRLARRYKAYIEKAKKYEEKYCRITGQEFVWDYED